ncbi:E3 ubiquitin-protein ligase RFWD3-like [Orbicella faveolata]|uniref:E3 ubiquitin-protein ligase RFWD3-like n=1 Tax=Orbicella faveolata TaxID=48498 RepID=UPI0009E2D801|nr:E3 ubiquitin-protein ligase RFWD3-like [Orbicella faveolata]
MATIHYPEDVEVEEFAQEIVINTGSNVVDLTEPDDEDQEMEIDNGGDDGAESQGIQPSNDENNVPEDTELQSSMQNSTPAVARSVQVLGVLAVNSPDEFQNKASKPSSKNTSKVKISKSPLKSPEKDDDSQSCPICFEPWSNSGAHRLSSLSCGHLFGRSCIERWLKAKGGNDKCPQCNAPAKKKDIRNIYTKAVKSIDTTERDRALADLEKEKEARQKAEEREARALLQYQLAKAECEKIVTQLKKQEQLVSSLQRERNGRSLLKSGDSLKPVSSLDSKHCEYVRIHQKAVRDVAFNCRGDGLLLTASMDKTVRVTSMLSNTVVQT